MITFFSNLLNIQHLINNHLFGLTVVNNYSTFLYTSNDCSTFLYISLLSYESRMLGF